MKKSLITIIAGVLATIVASFIGSTNSGITIGQNQLEELFVNIGDTIVDSSTDSQNNDTKINVVINDIPWATGEFNSPVENLIYHFEKHGSDIGVNSPQEYYDTANDIIDDDISIRINDFYYENSVDYLQPETRFLVGLNPGGSINTLYKVTSDAKLQRLYDYIAMQ